MLNPSLHTRPASLKTSPSVFKVAHNCCEITRASHASLLIDCANYYHALHEAIRRARHSIFVLGWDIDSRIKLLREHHEIENYPSTFFDLIQYKARQCPNVQIYLNRWDYSLYMAANKEIFSKLKWALHSPSNVHFCLDDTVPLGACHHQKIVTIDDEIAFCGGMDVARGRWDRREHCPKSTQRIDPNATYKPGVEWEFGPYHDIQIMVAGETAQVLAERARKRWKEATGDDPIPLRQPVSYLLPYVWPKNRVADFTDVPTAISMTLPAEIDRPATRQVERLYLDLIAQAEQFIYMENQYFTQETIARALNQRLRENQELRVLLVSSFDPEGLMERKAMWYGRVRFRDILESGGVKDRVTMAYPVSRVGGQEKAVRIHSKIMIVDDRYLRVGSSNINNRSMSLDTECDLVIEGHNEKSRRRIAALRSDLIREHTGREIKDIEKLIGSGADIEVFLNYITHSRQHLCRINDERYRYEAFGDIAIRLADPAEPLIPPAMRKWLARIRHGSYLRLLIIVLGIIGLALLWHVTPLSDYVSPEKLSMFFQQVRESSGSLPTALGLYALGCMILVPHVLLTAAALMVFPPLQAFGIALGGSLLSAAVGFGLGKVLGVKTLQGLLGKYADKICYYTKKGGLVGIALLRLLPIAPFTVVNMTLGMTHVSFLIFITATFLALFPGTACFAFLGHSLFELWRHPDPANILMVVASALLWIGIVVASHFLGRRWQNRATA